MRDHHSPRSEYGLPSSTAALITSGRGGSTPGIIGGKFFAARAGGYSGCRTKSELVEKRRMEERRSGQTVLNAFWVLHRLWLVLLLYLYG